MLVGYTVTVFRKADSRFRMPAPVRWTPTNGPPLFNSGVVPLISKELYWSTVKPGRAARSTAAAPATIGAEKLVPEARK